MSVTVSDWIPDRVRRNSCIWPPTPNSKPRWTNSVRMYVPASQLIHTIPGSNHSSSYYQSAMLNQIIIQNQHQIQEYLNDSTIQLQIANSICLLCFDTVGWANGLHMVQLMPLHHNTPSCLASFRSRLLLPFWYRLVPEKMPLNRCTAEAVVAEITDSTASDQTVQQFHQSFPLQTLFIPKDWLHGFLTAISAVVSNKFFSFCFCMELSWLHVSFRQQWQHSLSLCSMNRQWLKKCVNKWKVL